MTSRISAEDFATFAAAAYGEPTTEATLEHILGFARSATGADHAGVMLVRRRHRIETVAATDPLIADIDALQTQLGEGPDLEVLSERLSLMIPDIATETRWPRWAAQVSACGIRSLLSVRMYTAELTVGTLNLYAARPEAFEVDDQEVAHVLGRHAAVVLALRMKQDNLLQAIEARNLIGQAQGILMERFDLTADQAFAVLLRYSHDQNMKLSAVADTLVRTSALPGER